MAFWDRRHAEPEPVDLTNEGYARWVRAERPPLPWFLALSDENQETLAVIAEDIVEARLADLAVAIGYGVADPAVADAGLDAAEDPESEEMLVRRAAADLAANFLRGSRKRPASPVEPPAPVSMGGVGKAREASDKAAENGEAPKPDRSLFGISPDTVEDK